MASPNAYNPGGTTGARFATRSPLLMSGAIWYVCSASPNAADAAAPAGRQRTRPLLTVTQAITNAAAGDTIQCLEGHSENPGATFTVNKAGLWITSEGDADTRARFSTALSISLFTVSAAGVVLENLSILAPVVGTGITGATFTAINCQVINCSFSLNSSNAAGVTLGATSSGARLKGCTFTAAGIDAATRPASALLINAAATDVELDTCSFDGGTYGWTTYALLASAAVTRLVGWDCDFLNDSDMQVATGSVYKFHRRYVSGSSWQEFAA